MELFGNGFKNFLEIGPLTITMYAFCIVLGMIVGTLVCLKEGKKVGITKEVLLDGLLYGIPLGIIGARIYYVIFEWDRYHVEGDIVQSLLNACKINEGGLAITGGILVAIVFVFLYCKWKKVNLLVALDLLPIGLLIGQIFGRWGNFFNQEAHGGEIQNVDFMFKLLPDWIMEHMYFRSDGLTTYWHPTFLYESMWNLVGVFIILIAIRKFKKNQIGDFLGFYLIWYGFGRAVLIEPFRTDALMLGDLRINVVLPALMVVAGVIYLVVKHIKFPQEKYCELVNRIALDNQENPYDLDEIMAEVLEKDQE